MFEVGTDERRSPGVRVKIQKILGGDGRLVQIVGTLRRDE